jgi:hypothetical protein
LIRAKDAKQTYLRCGIVKQIWLCYMQNWIVKEMNASREGQVRKAKSSNLKSGDLKSVDLKSVDLKSVDLKSGGLGNPESGNPESSNPNSGNPVQEIRARKCKEVLMPAVAEATSATATKSHPRGCDLPTCPVCADSMVAAEASAYVSDNLISYLWTCDTCGYGFVTKHTLRRLSRN